MVCCIQHGGEVCAFKHVGHLSVIFHLQLAPELQGDMTACLNVDAVRGIRLADVQVIVAYIHLQGIIAVIAFEACQLLGIATEVDRHEGIADASRDVGLSRYVLPDFYAFRSDIVRCVDSHQSIVSIGDGNIVAACGQRDFVFGEDIVVNSSSGFIDDAKTEVCHAGNAQVGGCGASGSCVDVSQRQLQTSAFAHRDGFLFADTCRQAVGQAKQ